jgi:hypothetical protein
MEAGDTPDFLDVQLREAGTTIPLLYQEAIAVDKIKGLTLINPKYAPAKTNQLVEPTLTVGDSIKTSNSSPWTYTYYYSVQAGHGDQGGLGVKVGRDYVWQARFRTSAPPDTGTHKVSEPSLRLDGDRYNTFQMISALPVPCGVSLTNLAGGDTLKIGDVLDVAIYLTTDATNRFNEAFDDADKLWWTTFNVAPLGANDASKGPIVDMDAEEVRKGLVDSTFKSYTLKDGDSDDLNPITMGSWSWSAVYGFVRDLGGNLSSTTEVGIEGPTATPQGFQSCKLFRLDAKSPTVKFDRPVAGGCFTDRDNQEGANVPAARFAGVNDPDSTFKFTISEDVKTLKATFKGAKTFTKTWNNARKGQYVLSATAGVYPMSWAPTAFDGWTTLEAGTYDVTVDMTDFTGNTGTGTLLGVEYDPKDIVVSRVFPMSRAAAAVFYGTAEAGIDTINQSLAVMKYTLDTDADSLVIRLTKVAGQDSIAVGETRDLGWGPKTPSPNLAAGRHEVALTMHDSTQYNMSIWALDPCGNVTELEGGDIWYYEFFVPPTLAYFDISIMGGCDVKAPKDSTIAGNSLTVTVTAMDADSSRRAVAYEGDATLASIMQGPTATPSWKEENGVVDLGGGMASLDGTYWVGGQQVLTVTDNTAETIAMVTVTDAGDSTLTGSSGSLTWVPAMFTSFVIVPDSSVQYVGEPSRYWCGRLISTATLALPCPGVFRAGIVSCG